MSKYERNDLLADETTKAHGTAKFHVLPERSESLLDSMGSVTIDGKAVAELMRTFLREVVIERLTAINIETSIKDGLDRRVDVAVKDAVKRAEADMTRIAVEQLRKRVTESVAALEISVTVNIKEAP